MVQNRLIAPNIAIRFCRRQTPWTRRSVGPRIESDKTGVVMYAIGTVRNDAPAALPRRSLENPGWRRKLLLVDDHELVRYGAKALYTELLGVPLEWLEASTLREALDIYRRESDIDAVLRDLNLSDCKGLQGLRQFVQEFPQARIAVFSATQDEFVIRQAQALGAVGYVAKGAVAAEILGTLSALLWPS